MNLLDIDNSRLKFPKLKKLIKDQMANGVIEFTDLISTVPNKTEIEKFGFVKDEYLFNHPVEVVFNKYITANPEVAWDGGGLISFGLGVDKISGDIYYPGDAYPGVKVGQVLYFHSSIFGLKKISMAQEVITMDEAKFLIEFSYIEKGMTTGIQSMQFSKVNKNQSKIIHTSRFKGVSSFRDKFLYPYFHSKLISKFHGNLKKSLG